MRPYFTLDYNWTILLFVLIILNSEIKHSDLVLDIKHDLLIGLLAGICVTIKQTMGLLIVVAIIGYKILEVRNLDDFKKFIKIAAIRFLGAAIPIVIVSMYLILNNALKDYIDYAILGISTFSNKISYVDRLLKNKNFLVLFFYFTPFRWIVMSHLLSSPLHLFTIEPLIGGLKCSFAFLERGAVDELFTGVECGE